MRCNHSLCRVLILALPTPVVGCQWLGSKVVDVYLLHFLIIWPIWIRPKNNLHLTRLVKGQMTCTTAMEAIDTSKPSEISP